MAFGWWCGMTDEGRHAPVDIVIYVRIEGSPVEKAGRLLELMERLKCLQVDGDIASYDWEAITI